MPEPTNCKSCGAAVIFVQSATTGNYLILNAQPDPKGNISIVDGKAHVHRKDDLFEEVSSFLRYLDHHATCPTVEQHRKKK
jgi:threonine aldolase